MMIVFMVHTVGVDVMLTDDDNIQKVDMDSDIVLDTFWPDGLRGTTIESLLLFSTKCCPRT